MSIKSFNICVVLDILDVTCPGVWICPKGMIYLDICMFGCNSSTSYVEPKFPLAFNETFSFHKTFAGPSNLRDIQKVLEEKYMKISLVQAYKNKQITLATYISYVDEVLYPEHNRLSKNGEMALLMKNEPLFPGTISPKITLVTKTSVTEQINVISRANDHCSPQYLETQNQPNRMKRVHHSKLMNSQYSHETEHRITNEDGNINSDTDTDSQLYCLRAKKTNNNIMDCECHLEKSCKPCEDMNRSKINEHRKETSDRKNINEALNLKDRFLDNDEYKNTEITSNQFGKNIKATFKVGAHHYKCCKSKLNNSSTNESIKTSDEDSIYEEKNRKIPVILEDSGEDPKKINPKIKARLQLDVYHCKCDTPGCLLSPSWRNICNEVNSIDTVGDTIKYHVSLRNYYKRLYDGTTYQLGRNLQLL